MSKVKIVKDRPVSYPVNDYPVNEYGLDEVVSYEPTLYESVKEKISESKTQKSSVHDLEELNELLVDGGFDTKPMRNIMNQKIVYDPLSEEWNEVLNMPEPSKIEPAKKKKSAKPLTNKQKIKKFDGVFAELEKMRLNYEGLDKTFRKLKYDYSIVLGKARQCDDYAAALRERDKQIEEFSHIIKEKTTQATKLSANIDEISERTIATETDQAEEKIKSRIRNGRLKELRGYFSWRLNNEKSKRNVLTDNDVNRVLSLIDKALE